MMLMAFLNVNESDNFWAMPFPAIFAIALWTGAALLVGVFQEIGAGAAVRVTVQNIATKVE